MRNQTDVPVLATKIGGVAKMFGCSNSTIRRRMEDDEEFPKPFRLTEEGDLLWLISECRTYLERKAGRQIAA